MKVALLTGCRDRHYAVGMITALAEKGLEVEVIGGDEVGNCDLDLSHVTFRKFGGFPSGTGRKALRVINYYFRLLRYAAIAKPQIFHILWNYRLEHFDRTVLMLYYKFFSKKIVLTLHNINAGKRDWNDSWLNRVTLRIQYQLADHLFVHTRKMKDDLVSEFHADEARVTVIPYGINNAIPVTGLTRSQARERLALSNGQKTILFFGNIGPYKGVEFLVAAFRRILVDETDYRLIIAGKARGGCENYVRSLAESIRRYRIEKEAQLKSEFIPDDQVEIYFKAADVLVLPYRSIFQSGVLFLAYSFGLPVIATDVGSFREDIIDGRTGFLCKPDDAEDLADTIERYFRSDLYRSLEEHRGEIREYAHCRNSWSTVAGLTADAYRRL